MLSTSAQITNNYWIQQIPTFSYNENVLHSSGCRPSKYTPAETNSEVISQSADMGKSAVLDTENFLQDFANRGYTFSNRDLIRKVLLVDSEALDALYCALDAINSMFDPGCSIQLEFEGEFGQYGSCFNFLIRASDYSDDFVKKLDEAFLKIINPRNRNSIPIYFLTDFAPVVA